eukprot:720850-Pyramimonas_sp.AAC.1
MAIIAPAFVIRQPVQVHSDCLGVVRLHNQSQSHVLSSRSKYAGLRRGFFELEGAPFIGQAFHTPAHRSLEVIEALPPSERRIGLANRAADLYLSLIHI